MNLAPRSRIVHSAEMANAPLREFYGPDVDLAKVDQELATAARAKMAEVERSREFVEAMVATQGRLMRAMGFESCRSAIRRLPELSDRYPHTCPRCSGPAYAGAVEVDCAGGCK